MDTSENKDLKKTIDVSIMDIDKSKGKNQESNSIEFVDDRVLDAAETYGKKKSSDMNKDDATNSNTTNDQKDIKENNKSDQDINSSDTKIEENSQKNDQVDLKKEDEFEIPKTLLNKYHLVDHKFHFRNDPDKVAFEDSGKTLKTDSNDKEIARSMIELAQAKKWDTIKVKGTEEFKRTVWLEASLKGMNVNGYKPKDVDIAMLNDLKKHENKHVNTIEKEVNKDLEKPIEKTKVIDQTAEELRKEKLQNLSENERALLTIFDRKMEKDNFTEKQREVSLDQAIEKLHDKKMHVGKLVDHGHAPYKNDPKNDPSYFATLQNEKGEKHTIWAKDLERTLKEQNIIKDDDIVLAYKGAKQVKVSTKDMGNTVANRGRWEAHSLTKLKETTEKALTRNEQTKLQLQHNAELKKASTYSHSQPKIQAYDVNAPKLKPKNEPQKQYKEKEREKSKEIPR